MQRSRQLLALGARLRQAAAVAAASGGGAAARAWQPAQQQLLSLNTLSGNSAARAVPEHAAALAATARRQAAAVGRRSFAADAVAKPRPAPRGASTAGSGRSLWSGMFLLVPGGLAAFLGKWQWERREWKRELLERREGMMQGEPLDLFAAEEAPEEYQRVFVEGTFDHAASQYVGPRTRQVAGTNKQGYLLMTPLRQAGGPRCVVVNRGWVPTEWREDARMRAEGQPTGKVRVEGLLRHSEDPGDFVPPNEPDKGNWFYVNAGELAVATGLPPEAPLVEVVTEAPGTYIGRGPPTATEILGGRRRGPDIQESYPLPKSMDDLLRFSVMPQDHFNYAATWWTLSAATLALAVKAIRQGVKAAR